MSNAYNIKPRTLGELLAEFPPPWSVGEAHELMCKIVDKDYREVCEIKSRNSSALAQAFVSFVNKHCGMSAVIQ